MTRFALITRACRPPEPTGDDLTTLAVSIRHDRIGALLAVLTELAMRGVNLTRIESRPTGEQLGRYAFFLDCAGHIDETRVGEAMMGLQRICADVRFLGSYPRAAHGGEQVPPPPEASDEAFVNAARWLSRLRAGGGGACRTGGGGAAGPLQ
jgi:prephenate dehydratase